VICAYTERRWNELRAAVASVQQQRYAPQEIIVVVDNNSALFERVCAEFPQVTAIENRYRRGLSGARNSGIAVARGEVIAFLDEDAIAAPDWLEHLLAPYDQPNVVGVGGAIEPLWLEGRPRWFPDEFNWVVGCTYRGLAPVLHPVRNLIGCNMSFRRTVFEAVGGFRDGMGRIGTKPLGCEETEFCIRLQQQEPQWVLLYEPRAGVAHAVPPTRARWRYFIERCFGEGVSKAQVTRSVGAQDGLASERTYALRTLPSGIARGLADTLFHVDVAGLGRAVAITAGLGTTIAGYLTSWLWHRWAN